MKLKIVNAAKIRNTIDTDFHGVGSHGDYPYIPLDELWIDSFLKNEKDLFLKLWKLERSMRGKSFRMIREKAKKTFTLPKKVKIVVTKSVKKGELTIRYVNGASVRAALDPYFLLAGHHLVYSSIPKKEIWIDANIDPKEWKYWLIHALHERERMMQGMTHDDAHDFALAAQRMTRRKDGVAEFLRG